MQSNSSQNFFEFGENVFQDYEQSFKILIESNLKIIKENFILEMTIAGRRVRIFDYIPYYALDQLEFLQSLLLYGLEGLHYLSVVNNILKQSNDFNKLHEFLLSITERIVNSKIEVNEKTLNWIWEIIEKLSRYGVMDIFILFYPFITRLKLSGSLYGLTFLNLQSKVNLLKLKNCLKWESILISNALHI